MRRGPALSEDRSGVCLKTAAREPILRRPRAQGPSHMPQGGPRRAVVAVDPPWKGVALGSTHRKSRPPQSGIPGTVPSRHPPDPPLGSRGNGGFALLKAECPPRRTVGPEASPPRGVGLGPSRGTRFRRGGSVSSDSGDAPAAGLTYPYGFAIITRLVGLWRSWERA